MFILLINWTLWLLTQKCVFLIFRKRCDSFRPHYNLIPILHLLRIICTQRVVRIISILVIYFRNPFLVIQVYSNSHIFAIYTCIFKHPFHLSFSILCLSIYINLNFIILRTLIFLISNLPTTPFIFLITAFSLLISSILHKNRPFRFWINYIFICHTIFT